MGKYPVLADYVAYITLQYSTEQHLAAQYNTDREHKQHKAVQDSQRSGRVLCLLTRLWLHELVSFPVGADDVPPLRPKLLGQVTSDETSATTNAHLGAHSKQTSK